MKYDGQISSSGSIFVSTSKCQFKYLVESVKIPKYLFSIFFNKEDFLN